MRSKKTSRYKNDHQHADQQADLYEQIHLFCVEKGDRWILPFCDKADL